MLSPRALLDKYILQVGQIHFASAVLGFHICDGADPSGELMLIHRELGSGGHISCDSAPDYPNSTTSTTSTHPTYLVTRSTCAEPGGKRAEEKLAKEEKSRKSGGKKGHFITGRALPPR